MRSEEVVKKAKCGEKWSAWLHLSDRLFTIDLWPHLIVNDRTMTSCLSNSRPISKFRPGIEASGQTIHKMGVNSSKNRPIV